jgi:hypothetical protein
LYGDGGERTCFLDKVLALDGKDFVGDSAKAKEILDGGPAVVTLFLAKGDVKSRKVRVVLRRQVLSF